MLINELFWVFSKDPWRQSALEGSVVWYKKEHRLQNHKDRVGTHDLRPGVILWQLCYMAKGILQIQTRSLMR